MRFVNMSIRTKIISALLLVIVLGLMSFVTSIYFLNSIDVRISDLISSEVEKIKHANRVNADLLELHRAQKNLIIATDREQVERFKSHLSRHKVDLASTLVSLKRLANVEEYELIKSFEISYEEFLKANSQIESLMDYDWERFGDLSSPYYAGNALNRKAVDLSTGTGRIAYDRASEVLAELVKSTEISMDASGAESRGYIKLALLILLGISGAGITIGVLMGLHTARGIAENVNSLVSVADSIAGGDLKRPVEVTSRDELGLLAISVERMQKALLSAREAAQERDWLKTGIGRINDAMRGKTRTLELCRDTLSEAATYAGARVGAIFLEETDGGSRVLKLAGGYAYSSPAGFPDQFGPGEGLVGQAVVERKTILFNEVPKDYVKVCSGLGDTCPECITVSPLIFDDEVKGVLELGFLCSPSALQVHYLEQIMPAIAINVQSARGREDLAAALAHSRALYEELQQQQEELRSVNEELEEQTESLRKSHEQLLVQQEELEELNQELESKNLYLDHQKVEIEQANQALEKTKIEIEEKAQKLEVANRYKSEFLANMSHELRTPLNSMLLLSRMLANNNEGNLSDDQVRSAEIILSSGQDLLSLINEILDLSKIESGRMNFHFENVSVRELGAELLDSFKHVADAKGLQLSIDQDRNCPDTVWTDRKRVDQILRNLVSNAIKFTESGEVSILFGLSEDCGNDISEGHLLIAVADTGVGIPADKHAFVFEAFQQLEGGETRRYGGTGLGLSISRQLAHLLGGEIRLVSQEGAGSTFTLVLPLTAKSPGVSAKAAVRPEPEPRKTELACVGSAIYSIDDDRAVITNEDKSILIIEDDPIFAEVLVRICRNKGFKCLVAGTGEEGIAMAVEYLPKGIILDLRLPCKDGWAVLGELKEKPATRHVPIHIMSVDDASLEAFRQGAIGFLTKPAKEEDVVNALRKLENVFSRQIKRLLIIEDDKNLRESIMKLVGNGDVHTDEAATASEAMKAIKSESYDCMILDLGLPDMSGLEMLKLLSANVEIAVPPVIVYTGRELTQEEESELRRYSDSIIVKGVRSEERLFDETSLFLHRLVERMPSHKKRIITDLHDSDSVFREKRILIVDDDMRNVFALSSVLEERGMKTAKAENGRKALDLLDNSPDFDLVVLDIMMPVMDGYEAIRRIRARERFARLPVIALTAKAMKQDRERCIAAGASDYLTKPVDLDRLLSMMRVWLYR